MRAVLIWLALALVSCAGAATTTVGSSTTSSQVPTLSTTSSTSSTSSTTSSTAATTTSTEDRVDIEVVFSDGQVESGGGRVSIKQGSKVRLTVEADVSDEVHVHGYNLFADVSPDEKAEIEFRADIPGVFEVELEEAHKLLVELEVAP